MKRSTSRSLLSVPLFLAVAALAQQPWQQLQSPTSAEVRKAWLAPPPEYGPEPYYGMNGPVDEATIRRDLDTMKSLGYEAVTVQYGYGASFAYLSPEYFAFFKTFVAEAKKRDMRIWIVDDAGYPSGFAGGKFSAEHPELRMQALVVAQRVAAKGGDEIRQAVTADTVSVTAIGADGKSVPVAVTNNAIDWKAPAGNWTIAVVEHRFMTSPTRSDTNPKRVKDGTQSLEDYLDPAATAQYLAFTHDAYKKAVGDEFGKTILGFRGDEPDYSIQGLPWTPKFFDRFQHEKGYDIRPWLASFAPNVHVAGHQDGPPAPLSEQQRRAKADYYDVFSLMFRDGFFKPQGVWCAENHLEYQVHLNHEEMEMQLTRSEGSFFRDMQYVEIPGIDSIWHQIWTDTISDFPRLASSAAHVYGHPRAFTESFAAYRPEPDVTMARYILNEQFVRGVNLVETMYFPATSTPGRGGPAKYMQDPAYTALLAYVRRMSYLMSMGRPFADVALYLPSASMWMGDSAADAQFVSAERLLSEHQIDFDIVDEDFLANGCQVNVTDKTNRCPANKSAGDLTTASGNGFSTVIIPGATVLSEAALTRLQAFVKAGNRVLFLGGAPKLIYGKTLLDARAATPADSSFATVVDAQLPETPTPPAQPPSAAPAAMTVPPEIVAALSKAIGKRGMTLDTPDPAVRMTSRLLKGSEVYLYFNESASAVKHTLTFMAPYGKIEQWDPETGKITAVSKHPSDKGGSVIDLELKPYEARVLVATY